MHKVTHFELAYHRVSRLYVEMAPKMPIRTSEHGSYKPLQTHNMVYNVSINDNHH